MVSNRLQKLAINILVITLALTLAAPIMSADCAGNTLANGGFEGGFSDRSGGQIMVADGWGYFYQNGPFAEDGLNVRPTYGQERNGARIREGGTAQAFGMTYSTHNAGLYQQVSIPTGSDVSLSAWALAWSSTGDNSGLSEGGKYYLSVGIDPTGGTDWASPNIVWSGENTTLDQWVNLTLQTKAQNSTVTVFLRGRAEWKIKHNYSYWDDICVTYNAPPPPPTNTPAPTAIPTATSIPTATPLPTATPTLAPTATPVPASIKVVVFEDLDGNGIQDDGEAAISGATVELQKPAMSKVDTYVVEEDTLIDGLAAGTYMLVKTNPEGYTSVTPNQATVSLSAGETAEVFFAVKALPTPEPTTEATEPSAEATATAEAPAEDNSSNGNGGWSGILVAAIAVIILVGYRLLRNQVK